MVEVTLFSMCSCTLSQCNDLRIWSGLEDLGAAQQHYEQVHSGYVEGDLTVFEEDSSTSNCSTQVWSKQMCRWWEPYQSQERHMQRR